MQRVIQVFFSNKNVKILKFCVNCVYSSEKRLSKAEVRNSTQYFYWTAMTIEAIEATAARSQLCKAWTDTPTSNLM